MDLKYLIAQQRRRPQSPSLDIAFALDKSYNSRRGPKFTFSRPTSGTFVNENGHIVGKTSSTTTYNTSGVRIGNHITFDVPFGSVVGWLNGSVVIAHVDNSSGDNQVNNNEINIVGILTYKSDTSIILRVTSKGGTSATISNWTIGYCGLRIEYDPITAVCKGALIEDPATNIITGSEKFHESTYWSQIRLVDQPVSGETSPSNTPTAAKLIPNSENDNHRIDKTTVTLATSARYVISLFVKPDGYTGFGFGLTPSSPTIKAKFSLVGDGSATLIDSNYRYATIQKYPGGWYRCSATTDVLASGSYRLYYFVGENGNIFEYSGDGTSGIIVWGAQVEAVGSEISSASSYIPTYGTAAAFRGWDVLNITSTAFTSLYNQFKSTIFVRASKPKNNKPSAYFQFQSSDVAASSINASARETYVSYSVVTASPWQRVADGSITGLDTSTITNTAVAIEANNFAISVNGSNSLTDNDGLLNFTYPMQKVCIGMNNSNAQSINGHISRFTYYPYRLSNAKLQELTTSTIQTLTYNGTPIIYNNNTNNITL